MNRIVYRAQKSDEGRLLREVIASRINVSKRLMKRCKAHPQGILVNGQRRTVRYVVQAGDEISLTMAPSEHSSDIIHEAKPLHVIYEDDMLLVVDKPPGITMFPRHRGEQGSLAGIVLSHLEKEGGPCVFHPVSRLDIGTSGLVLLAKNSFAAAKLSEQRQEKCYQCFALGHLQSPLDLTGDICEIPSEIRHAIGPLFFVGANGKHCRTHVWPLFYEPLQQATACWVRIDTGRRHQIRVHLAHQGHPLLGDTTYGGPALPCCRPLLHAAALSYIHPVTQKSMHHFLPMHIYDKEPSFITHDAMQIDRSETR